MRCNVCRTLSTELFSKVDNKIYWKCNTCLVIFLDHKYRLSKEEEKSRYEQHQNNIYDRNYRLFLSKLFNPLRNNLRSDFRGLDFGCGPGPALAEMFREEGFVVDIYDPFFFPIKSNLNKKYNFIACSEVVEHFFNPIKEFKLLDSVLQQDGLIGIMTSFLESEDEFDHWYYRKDPTHVHFYQRYTFEVIASRMGWSHQIVSNNIVLFKKS